MSHNTSMSNLRGSSLMCFATLRKSLVFIKFVSFHQLNFAANPQTTASRMNPPNAISATRSLKVDLGV